jgi:hypothetical protein
MNAAAKYDLACYHVSRVYPSRLDPEMTKALAEISGTVASVLAASGEVEAKAKDALPQVYAFRLKALNWLMADSAFDLLDETDNLLAQVAQGPPRLYDLAQTVVFGLKWHRRVLANMWQASPDEATPMPPPPDYRELKAALGQVPGDLANKLAQWVDTGLMFELGAMAHDMLADGTVSANEGAIREMVLATADAAQEYAALAAQLGFVKLATPKLAPRARASAEEIAEQQALAEEGMADYAKHLGIHE